MTVGQTFAGAILVGVSPSYFSDFDRTLFAGDTDYIVLICCAPTALCSLDYPESTGLSEGAVRDQLLVDAIARNPLGGVVRRPLLGRSIRDRLVAYSR